MTHSTTALVGSTNWYDTQQDRQFDPWRKPETPAARSFVSTILMMIDDHEIRKQLRQRRRRAKDYDTFQSAVSALVSDLAIATFSEDHRGLRLYRSNGKLKFNSRYRTPITTKVLPDLLDLLAAPELNLLEQDVGEGAQNATGIQTIIRPSSKFAALVRSYGLSPCDFGETVALEPLELKDEKVLRDRSAPRVDYVDTETTLRFREEMRTINQSLVDADIVYVGPNRVDIRKRQLRRVFTRNSFQSGGRLYGGFWQPVSKADRLRHLRINGQQVVELDYGQIMPRVVYSLVKVVPSMDDLYAIPRYEECRSGIKRLMSSMLFVDSRMTRFPKGTRDLFPAKVRVSDVVDAIIAAHPAIAHLFFTGIGHRCQFVESQIMVEVLRIIQGIGSIGGVALPIHDAILVPASAQHVATNVMKHTFKRTTKLEAVVDVVTVDDMVDDQLLAAA